MKDWWRKWSYEVPLAISDALWEVLVVRFAALLDQLTLRRVIAFIPVLIVILAYAHSIPLPPELMLVGDALAYIDILSVIVLLGVVSRAATILFIVKQAAEHAARLVNSARERVQRLDFRHRRQHGAKDRSRFAGRTKNEDDEYAASRGVAWA